MPVIAERSVVSFSCIPTVDDLVDDWTAFSQKEVHQGSEARSDSQHKPNLKLLGASLKLGGLLLCLSSLFSLTGIPTRMYT